MNPVIIVFDIETFPIRALTWGPKWEANLLEIEEYCRLASFSYKVVGEKKTYVYGQNTLSYKQLVVELWKMAEKADILIAHNGKSFDVKMMNVFFIDQGLLPPSPYRLIDTKLEARKYFRFPSNSLNDLAHFLGLGQKEETGGFSLWKKCAEGDEKAWKKMLSYNKQDVDLLEQVYLKMRPYMSNHPTVPGMACICGCTVFHKRGFEYNTNRSKRRQNFRCRDCRVSKYGVWEKTSESTSIVSTVLQPIPLPSILMPNRD